MIGVQLIIGGFVFGIESLKLPVINYCYDSKNLISHSVFEYMIIRIIVKMPFLLMIQLIGMIIGVISTNTIITIILPFLLYFFTPTIQSLVMNSKLNFIKFSIPLNWNFKDYLFGGISEIPYMNLELSIIIWGLHFTIIGILTLFCFKRKNIKNI